MAAIARSHKIKVVLMSQPAVFDDVMIALAFGHKPYNKYILYPRNEELIQLFEIYNKIIAEVAAEEKIPFIDMYQLMGHNEEDFIDMVHYSSRGLEKFYQIYSENLEKIIASQM